MARKRVRKNYYKNSRAQRRRRVISRCLIGLKIMLLAGGIAGISLLLILAHDTVTQSTYFEARIITVKGNQRFSKEAILDEAGVKLHDNILALNLNTLRYKLLAMPWIEDAEVERELPDSVHIRVKERVPIAIVDLSRSTSLVNLTATASLSQEGRDQACPPMLGDGSRAKRAGFSGRLFYLDERGEIFKPVESTDKVSMPVVTGISLSDIDFNNESRSWLFKAVMEVLRLSRLHQNVIPRYALQRIHVDRKMGLTLYASFDSRNLPTSSDGALTSIGNSEKLSKTDQNTVKINVGFGGYGSKYSRLRDIIRYLEKESRFLNLESIDLIDSDRVVVRPFLAGHGTRRSVAGGRDPCLSKAEAIQIGSRAGERGCKGAG